MKKKIIFFLLLALISAASKASPSVPEYFVTCDPDSLKYIYEHYEEDHYIPVTFKFNDRIWENVRMRIRGDDSRKFPKKSLKFSFDSELFSNGRDALNFNAEYLDLSFIHQYLSSRLFRESGHECFETEHARLYINGKFFGLYLRVENVDADFMKANGLDPKGNLYKATNDGACLNMDDDVFVHWEKKTNDPSDRKDLSDLIDSLNNVPDAEYYNFAKRTFDYKKMINILAMNMVLSNASTYYHNYYMYRDPTTKKWTMLPWDLDKTFSHYGEYVPYDFSAPIWFRDNPFVDRALICRPIYNDIYARINEICAALFTENRLYPIIDSLGNILLSSVVEDATDQAADKNAYIESINKEKHFISERYGILKNMFEKSPLPFRVHKLEKTFTKDEKITVKWNKTTDMKGGPVKYKINYIEESKISYTGLNEITDITDTFYTYAQKLPEDTYFLQVKAYTSGYETTGYDSHNLFTVKYGSTLPCDITTNTTLTKEGSPYVLNCDVNVAKNVTLTIKEGVEIRFPQSGNIFVRGAIKCYGTASEPVVFKPADGAEYWEFIKIDKPTDTCYINHAIINNGRLDMQDANFVIENSIFNNTRVFGEDWRDLLINHENGSFQMNGCTVNNNRTGAGMFTRKAYSVVKNSTFYNFIDPIEFNETTEAYIINNAIYYSPDDGIDLNGCQNVMIYGNRIYDSFDKGISIGSDMTGPSKNIIIQNNLITGCATAISIKDSSEASLFNNTFYNNGEGVECYEKTAGRTGGKVDMKNTIIAGSGDSSIIVDSKSRLNVTYTLCDYELLSGEGNIFAGPKFKAPEKNDFTLQMTSPCIDSGDPNSPKDPDGSRADIGAFPFDKRKNSIVINEINYNSAPDFDPGDWVEFYNVSGAGVDISGWYFSDEKDSHKFVFPTGTIIKEDSYLVLCADMNMFKPLFPEAKNIIGNMDFGFSGSGELLRLFDKSAYLIDSVLYRDTIPWPSEPDGTGPTLELQNPFLDNAKAIYWHASAGHGTPGAENGVYNPNEIRDIIAAPGLSLKITPNPASDNATVILNLDEGRALEVGLFDIFGRQAARLSANYYPAGIHEIPINLARKTPGLYYCKVISDRLMLSVKFIVIK